MPKETKSKSRKRPRQAIRGKLPSQPPAAVSRSREQMRALEATLASLAHDIRTPLTAILALSELLQTSGLGERERGWARTIKSTGEHLATLASLIVDAVGARHRRLVLRRVLFH